MRTLLLSLVCITFATIGRAEPFEIKDGDRVLFLGDTLLEREGTYGYFETRMAEQFPDRRFTVRNLAFSGDTPRGWSRASFDPPEKGWERLKEQIALVKPTVVFLGYGMAASLQEMTDRSQDWTLNPDPARYGAEPMSAARFKKELAQCMDAIISTTEGTESTETKKEAASPSASPSVSSVPSVVKKSAVRFVLLSPIRHEDLRAIRPSLPDPTEHNLLLDQYNKAIKELAEERRARFVSLLYICRVADRPWTDNGIHPSEEGYERWSEEVSWSLGWSRGEAIPQSAIRNPQLLRAAIIRKNELFFHRWRPANETYLFGFRKHEQGRNAKEMPMFDPLIEAAEAEIERLKRAPGTEKPRIDAANPRHGGAKPGENAGKTGVLTSSGQFPAATDERRASGRAGLQPAVPGILPGTPNVEKPSPRDTPSATDPTRASSANARASSSDAPGRIPGAAGNIPALPANADADTSRQTPAEKPDLSQIAAGAAFTMPDFTVADGLEISLWAENPLLAKPTQMNWDAQGRLWVASSAMYPQIAPGQAAFDKIIILEDADRDGKAEKSTVFADGLLIPTGVAPVLVQESGVRSQESEKTPDANLTPDPRLLTPSAAPRWACYVGQSTELLYFEDTDGDGKADKKRIVLSGFGTEDTHHIVHTLRWGPDGRLYFNQSIYIHTHMETPWGLVRLNSGGVFAYDPRTERVEVFCKGLWNTWGHAWDQWGQSFLTDGAGRDGISWAFPGAIFAPSEGARRTMPSISPGNYPKFCGLEIIYSPHFPADWQGTAVTCDFRAHKIVHFKINDLAQGPGVRSQESGKTPAANLTPDSRLLTPPTSGYIAEQLPVLVQTSDATFRPIDVKLGPDGALYIADWSNPIINHGEVDFRDPRRDHEHGRIWRLSRKGGAAVKWESLVGKKTEELLEKLLSENLWDKDGARRVLGSRPSRLDEDLPIIGWLESHDGGNTGANERVRLEASWLWANMGRPRYNFSSYHASAADARYRANGAQMIGYDMHVCTRIDVNLPNVAALLTWFEKLLGDSSPRVRLETMRALARVPTLENASLILDAAINAPKDDPYYDFAAWRSVNDLAPQVAEWVEKNSAASAELDRAPQGKGRASGSARASRAVPGAPPGTSNVEPRPNSDQPPNARTQTHDASGAAPDAARGARALPSAPDSPANPETRDAKIVFALESLPADVTGPLLTKILVNRPLTRDGAGPWIELIGKGGGKAEVQMLAARVAEGGFEQAALVRAMNALAEAARIRDLRPDAASPRVAELIDSPDAATRTAAARLAGLWRLADAAPRLEALASAPAADLRAAAFDGLRTLGGPAVPVLQRLVKSTNPAVPPPALAALAQVKPDAAVAEIPAVLGAIQSEQELMQTWRAILQSNAAMNQLAKKFPADVPKPVLVTALRAARELGRKGQPLANKLAPLAGELATAGGPANYADLAARAKNDGDPVAGEALYRRTASACVTCHAIGGAGGKLGPDMTSIGASAPLDYIIESLLDPAAKVKEGYHAFAFAMKDGTEAIGIPLRETAQEQFIRTVAGEQPLPKASIVSKKLAEGGASLMPAGLTAAWSDRERLNLYAFLTELGRPGPFDASRNNVARVWQLTDFGKVDGALKNVAADVNPRADRSSGTGQPALSQARLQDSAPAIFAYTLVDGRLTKDLLVEKLAMLQPKNDTVHLTARFQSASGGRAKFNLTGIRKAWLDGQPLAIASEPSPSIDLSPGAHTFTVEVETKSPPEVLRLESPAASFLGD